MIFKVWVEVGHIGSGNSMVLTRHVSARDTVDAYMVASKIPRVRKALKVEKFGGDKRQLLIDLFKDIVPFWFEPRVATQIILMLIKVAFELGGESCASSANSVCTVYNC